MENLSCHSNESSWTLTDNKNIYTYIEGNLLSMHVSTL